MRRAALVAGCALLVASCGNNGGRLSKGEYVRRADAICTRYNDATKALGTPGSGLENLARFADRSLPVLERAIVELRNLKPPKDSQELARRWLSSLAILRTDVVKIRDAARANDLAGVRGLAAAARRDDAATNGIARQLGTRVCSAG